MAVIQLPKDPRYSGWDEALKSFGLGMQGMAEAKQKKGMLELTLLEEHGGVIPVGEISKTAKRLGLDEGTLIKIMEPVHAQAGPEEMGQGMSMSINKPVVAYKMASKSERMLKAMRASEMLKEEMNRIFGLDRIKREAKRAEAVTAAEVGAKEPEREAAQTRAETAVEGAVTTAKIRTESAEAQTTARIKSAETIAGKRIDATKDVVEYKVQAAKDAQAQAQKYTKENIDMEEKYRQTMTDKQKTEMNLNDARAEYLRAQAGYLEAGGKDAAK